MKTIKVNFIDMAKDLDENGFHGEEMEYIYQRLCKYYNVEITNNNPHVVFCDFYGMDFIKYNCVRVSVFPEEYAPNFNVYDYAITLFQDFSYKDRVLCLDVPIYFKSYYNKLAQVIERPTFTNRDLMKKSEFCSFVQSKDIGADPIRLNFFHELSKYKKVNSGGRIENNIGGPVKNKLEFEKKHKFSISFINGRTFCMTDRPLDAFAAGTMPIYWGNSDIGKVYNTKAFVNCHDFDSFQDIIAYIEKIDNDDKLYVKMMNEAVFVEEKTIESEVKKFDDFLINIIENGTIQRSGVYWNRVFEKETYRGRKKYTRVYRIANKIRPITKGVFSSKIGRKVKERLIKKIHKSEMKGAYKG